MNWLRRNAEVLQGIGAIATAIVAVAALIGIKVQIDAADATAQAQTAREIYRDHLTLSIANPDLAAPQRCLPFTDNRLVAYENYFEHLLYTAEQVVASDPTWADTFENTLARHPDQICGETDWDAYPDDIQAIIRNAQLAQCKTYVMCNEQ